MIIIDHYNCAYNKINYETMSIRYVIAIVKSFSEQL